MKGYKRSKDFRTYKCWFIVKLSRPIPSALFVETGNDPFKLLYARSNQTMLTSAPSDGGIGPVRSLLFRALEIDVHTLTISVFQQYD